MEKGRSSSRLATVLAGLFLLLILAGLAARLWVTDRAYDFTGPVHITASGNGVMLNTSGELVRLSTAGELVEVRELQEAGLPAEPIDLRWLKSGELLVAGQRPATIDICNVDSWSCSPLGGPPIDQIQRQFKIVPEADQGRWLLSDARGDSLWRLNESAQELEEVLPPRILAGANGLAFDEDGHPWVADTDNRRIVELLPLEDGTFVTAREHSAVNDLTIGERYYPMLIERGPDGLWWVAQAAEFTEAHSDLVIYDADEGAVAVVKLPAGAYATDLVVNEGNVLVTDLERFTVYSVDGTTRSVSEFGDAAFREHMAGLKSQREMYGRLNLLTLVVIIVSAIGMIFAVVRVTPKERRWSKRESLPDLENAPLETPAVKGIHWLERNPKLSWMLKWYDRVYYLALCALVGCFLAMYFWAIPASGIENSGKLGLVMVLLCLVLASFAPLVHFSKRVMNRGLGSDGKQIWLRLENGREMAVDPDQLVYSPRIVLYRQYSFPIRAGNWRDGMYRQEEIEQWLAPLLRRSTKVSEWQILRHQWKYKDPLLVATGSALTFLTVVVILMEMLL